MISVIEVADERRSRDRKRKRLLLQVGDRSWHLSREEGAELLKQLKHAMRKRKHVKRQSRWRRLVQNGVWGRKRVIE